MLPDPGSSVARRRRLFSSTFISVSLYFLFDREFLHGFLEIWGFWISFVVEGYVRRLRGCFKALCLLFFICNPVSPAMTMLVTDLVLTTQVCGIPSLITRPDLKARGLLFSSFCWSLISLFSEKTLLELLWYEQDLSLTDFACFRFVYDDLCLWGSTIYLVVGPEISTSGTLLLLYPLFRSSFLASMAFYEVHEFSVALHHVNFSMLRLPACAPSLQVVQILMSTGLALVLSYLSGSNTVMLGLEGVGGPLLLPYSQISSSFPPLVAGVVVKTYQNPLCWVQERTPSHSSVKEKICLSFAFSMRGTFCPDPIPLTFNSALDATELILARTKSLKCLSKSHVKVTICKLEDLEVYLESSVISYASGSFKIYFNTLSSFSKLVFLSFYCFRCCVVVAMRLAHWICPMLCSITVID